MGVWKDLLNAVVRWAVNLFLGWLVLKGVISEEQSLLWGGEVTAGIVVLLLTLGWALRDKYKSWVFGIIARQMQAGTPATKVKQEIKKLPARAKLNKVFKDAA